MDHTVTDLLWCPAVLDTLDHALAKLRMFDQFALSSTTFRLHQVSSGTVIAIATRHAFVRVDARILARMGAVLELEAQTPKAEYLNALREMATARRGLIKDRVTVKTRMQTTTQTLLKRQLRERLTQVEKHLEQIDKAITELICHDDQLAAKFEILTSVPCISKVTAFSMLIEMPELGTMSGKQAACLAGLAPISRQSGKWQGKERIRGGRAFFRRAMYMPALCVIRHDLSAKRKYDQLVQAGKPPKVALTAIMRKLVVVANALLRDGRKWSESCA